MENLKELQALQNFADKFNLSVKTYNFEDKRKKLKYILVNEKTKCSISPILDYKGINHFLLGIYATKKFNF